MKQTVKREFLNILTTIVVTFVLYFFMLPPLNPMAPEFWTFLVFIGAVYFITKFFSSLKKIIFQATGTTSNNEIYKMTNKSKKVKIVILSIVGVVVAIVAINIINSPLFNASAYQNRITINEDGNFVDDVAEVDFNAIPLLDKDSSQKLGDRVMGEMPDLVSQFTVSNMYTQINYNNDIVRVTPLEYADMIKYFTNRSDGVKGYIIVNSVSGKSELVQLESGMKYMPSAILFENLERKLRFSYPTAIFGDESFEIDDNGSPYWIIPTLKYSGIGLREEVTGVVIFDPITGNSQRYSIDEIPTWVDHVYPSALIIEQINDWGKYTNGFINSMFGQKGVVATSDGYNYTVMNNDVYLYTGITSVSSDQSNIGFILCNMRTKETNFYSASGAEE